MSLVFLQPLKLEQYAPTFDREAVEDPDDLMQLTMTDLIEDFKMKKHHAAKLHKWLNKGGGEGAGAVADGGAPSPPALASMPSEAAIVAARKEMSWDFFLSHYAYEAGDIAALVATQLEHRGFRPWYNKWHGKVNLLGERIDVTPSGMRCGVRRSGVFVLFLSKAVFTRPFCRLEILTALRARRPFVTLMETERRGQVFDFGEAAKKDVPESFHPIVDKITMNIGAIPIRRDREEQELMLQKMSAPYLEGLGMVVLEVDEETLTMAERGEKAQHAESPAKRPATGKSITSRAVLAAAMRTPPTAALQTGDGAQLRASEAAPSRHPRAGMSSPRGDQLLSGVCWPDSVHFAGHDSYWKDLMGEYRRITGARDTAFSTSHGAPRYALQLRHQSFQHPWRTAEQYSRVHLVYRADGHWTIGPVGDAQSGRRGDNLFNRGWIRTVRSSAPGSLPGRGESWSYLGKPRFGRLGLQGKLELVPYVIERAMWLNKSEPVLL